MTLTVLAVNVNSPSRDRAGRQVTALLNSAADVLVLTEVKKSDGGEVLVNGLRADGFNVLGWGSKFDGFTTLIATKVPFEEDNLTPGRVRRVTLKSTPSISILGAYGVSSDPFGRNSPDKIDAKKAWLRAFVEEVRESARSLDNLLIIGDLNFVDDKPVPQYSSIYDFERVAYADVLSLAMTDLLRGSDDFSWSNHRGQGFRYDHAFSSADLRPYVSAAKLEHHWRNGDERVTDHSAIRVQTSATFTPDLGDGHPIDEHPTLF